MRNLVHPPALFLKFACHVQIVHSARNAGRVTRMRARARIGGRKLRALAEDGRSTGAPRTLPGTYNIHETNETSPAMPYMHNPPPPCETLRADVLPALGLTVTQAARQLGVSRGVLSRVLNGRAPITAEFALRIELWLGDERGGNADHWIAMQRSYDLWLARQHADSLKVTPAPR